MDSENTLQPMVPYQKIGLDKLQLYNIAVEELDISHLLNIPKVEIQQATNGRQCRRHMPDSKKGIAKITIKDNDIFPDLTIGCANKSNGHPIEYVYLNLTIPDYNGNNLIPWTVSEYNNYIQSVLSYIWFKYHISLDACCMKVKYLEINCNIPLEEDFCHYSRSYRLMLSLMNGHIGKLSTYERIKNNKKNNKSAQGESLKRGNKSMEVIFYDKLQELNDTGNNIDEIDTPILRIEYRLKTKNKIRNEFNSNLWRNFNDKKIADYFISQIRKEFSTKLNKWEMQRQKDLKRLIKLCRAKSSKAWHHLLMEEIRNKSENLGIPYILDIEQVYDAIKSFTDKNRNRKVKSLGKIQVEDDVYKNHDLEKAYEVLQGTELAYQNTISLYSNESEKKRN